MTIQVRTIACVNNAGFVMSFGIDMVDPNTGLALIVEDLDTGNYPIDQTRIIDLAVTGIPEGSLVRPEVRPVWGSAKHGDRFVQYDPNSEETATYDARGTLVSYSVHLIGT